MPRRHALWARELGAVASLPALPQNVGPHLAPAGVPNQRARPSAVVAHVAIPPSGRSYVPTSRTNAPSAKVFLKLGPATQSSTKHWIARDGPGLGRSTSLGAPRPATLVRRCAILVWPQMPKATASCHTGGRAARAPARQRDPRHRTAACARAPGHGRGRRRNGRRGGGARADGRRGPSWRPATQRGGSAPARHRGSLDGPTWSTATNAGDADASREPRSTHRRERHHGCNS